MISVKGQQEAIRLIDRMGAEQTPFFFMVSYDRKKWVVLPLSEISPSELWYDFNGRTNLPMSLPFEKKTVEWQTFPESYAEYKRSFDLVQVHLRRGDSFLVNLTAPTEVRTNLSLRDIFLRTHAKYRLWWKDHFTMFSPEIFIRTRDREISTYPMKGTIDATLPQAVSRLMDDRKEAAEHATVTDLLRNDLSQVAEQVRVKRYRYIDRIETQCGPLLQTSTEISGQLPSDHLSRLGTNLFRLLPAGSVTGAPKPKTLEIIREAERYDRGWYAGVTGVFDGCNIDSAVIIRYIEQTSDGRKFFKSGGGITFQSDCRTEYEELKQKVYLPFRQK